MKLYVGITASISLDYLIAYGAQFLNITFLFILFALASVTAVLATVIVTLLSLHASLNHINLTLEL